MSPSRTQHKRLALLNVSCAPARVRHRPVVRKVLRSAHAFSNPTIVDYKNFVETVRLVEWFIQTRPSEFQTTNATPTTEYLGENGWSETSSVAFAAAFPMILGHQDGLNWQADSCSSQNLEPIETVFVVFSLFAVVVTDLDTRLFSFMDALWQSNGAINPADVANGSAAYDHHSYYWLVPHPNSSIARIVLLTLLLAVPQLWRTLTIDSFFSFFSLSISISLAGCYRSLSGCLHARPLQCVRVVHPRSLPRSFLAF